MQRAFVDVGGRQVHYRHAGQGAPVVMLHPSPLSSSAVWPIGEALAKHFEVFALDTPGYGASDPLPQPAKSLADYLPALAATLDGLGLQRICLYGCATGAQIAIEFAKQYPQRCALLVLDTAGHIAADECEQIVRDYFPDVTPQADGRHLVTLWHMVRELFVFFPWCDTRASSRVQRDLPPPAIMQGMLLDYLRAGENYHLAYRPAFYNERAERTVAVEVPTLLTRWAGSIALRITDALIAYGLPPHFSVLPLGPSMAERCDGIAAALRDRYRDGQPRTVVASHSAANAAARIRSSFVRIGADRLHLRRSAGASGKPLLALHDCCGSARLTEFLLAREADTLLANRSLIALDQPGHGESDAAGSATQLGPRADAQRLLTLLEQLQIDEIDVVADGYAALTARTLAALRPGLVGSITTLRARERPVAGQQASDLPDLAPRVDGTHLLTAWHWLRAQALWTTPGNARRGAIRAGEPAAALEAPWLHAQFVELMKMGPRFAPEWQAFEAAAMHEESTP